MGPLPAAHTDRPYGIPDPSFKKVLFSVTFTGLSDGCVGLKRSGGKTRKEGSINATLRFSTASSAAACQTEPAHWTGVNPADANDFKWDSTWDRLVPQNP
jgi:hypothetical protein